MRDRLWPNLRFLVEYRKMSSDHDRLLQKINQLACLVHFPIEYSMLNGKYGRADNEYSTSVLGKGR